MDAQIIRNVAKANVYYGLIRVGEDDFKQECNFFKDTVGEGLRRLDIVPSVTGISTVTSIDMLLRLDRKEVITVSNEREAAHVEVLADLLGIQVKRIPREGYNMAVK